MTLFNEAALRRFQSGQTGLTEAGGSIGMPNPDDPRRQAEENRWVANSTTTQPASYAQRQNTGTTTVGGNMQPPSAESSERGVANTFPDTAGNIPNPANGYRPELGRIDVDAAGAEENEARRFLAERLAMLKSISPQSS